MPIEIHPVTSPHDQSFCDWLRHSSGALWDRMVGHRFTSDMANDRLSPEIFIRYLRYEHAFVRTAVLVFAHALIIAPTSEDRAHLVSIVQGLVGEQESYFQHRFAALGLSGEPLPQSELPNGALGLSEGALAMAAHAGFEEILSAMLAAEWMYHDWCRVAHAARPQRAECAEWIALHVAPAFADEVIWTKDRLNILGPQLDSLRRQRCADNFSRMLRLEIAFHDTPYGSSGSGAATG
jgi:thiaminase/transcriptional activator TenA